MPSKCAAHLRLRALAAIQVSIRVGDRLLDRLGGARRPFELDQVRQLLLGRRGTVAHRLERWLLAWLERLDQVAVDA